MPKDTLAYDDAAERIDFSVVTGASELALARDSERKQDAVSRLMKAWENKNTQRAAKGLGLTMVAVSLAACGTEAEPTPDPVPVEPVNQTFNLTTSTDILAGGAGNDTFVAPLQTLGGAAVNTLNNGDQLNGGAGTDTLVATINEDVTPASLASIEAVTVTLSGANAHTLGLLNAPDVQNITVVGSGAVLTLGNVQNALSSLNIVNQNVGVTLQTAASALTGTADVLNVNLASVTGGTLTLNQTAGTNGYETLAITSGGNVANTLAGIAGTAPTTLTIAGAQNLTITGALDAATRTIDASAATGNVTLALTNAAVHTVTGGSGNDTFNFTGTYVGGLAGTADRDIINGGAGRDTLVLNSAQASVTVNQANVTNIEIIELSNAVANNIDLTRFASADTLKLAAAAVGANTFTFNTGSTLEFTATAAGNNARTYQVLGTGTSDAITIKGVAGTNLGTAAQTFGGIETLTINTGAAGTGNFLIGDVGGADATLVMTASPGGATKIIVTGGNSLQLASTVTAGEIDASGLTGTGVRLDMTGGSMAGPAKITGSAQNDIIIGSGGIDTIIAGAGNDTITAGGGNDNIDITGGGSNTLVFGATAAANGVDTITGFNVGTVASGGDILHVINFGVTGAGGINVFSGADSGVVAVNSVTIVKFNADIANADFGEAGATNFAALFGVGKALSDQMAEGKAVIVVQGTDQSHVYFVTNDANAPIIPDEVAKVATLVGVTGADTFILDNFAFAAIV